MRILIACGSPKRAEGGAAGVVHNLAGELRARGHTVGCLFYEDLLAKRKLPARLETVDLARAIERYVEVHKADYDVINIHAPYGFLYGTRRRWKGPSVGPPYVMTMHGLEERRIHAMRREAAKGRAWYFGPKNRLWHRLYHMPTYRYSIVTADQSVVLNREAWSCLRSKYHRPADRVWYIPNGVERQFFLPREYSAPSARRLLFVGTWLDHKGVYYLRDAFAALAKEFPELELTIAGCGVEAEIVQRFFPAELQERLHIQARVSKQEMPGIYARHGLFVFPSLVEGMPLVLLEAMATGMPVVTTDTCGMADIVEDGHNGLLVKPADAEGFADAVRRLFLSQELRVRLGRAAQESMRDYTWELIARRFESVLWRALGKQPDAQTEMVGGARDSALSETADLLIPGSSESVEITETSMNVPIRFLSPDAVSAERTSSGERLFAHPFFAWIGIRPVQAQHTAAEHAALAKHAERRKSIVEIGVAEGASAVALAERMAPGGNLYLVDPFHLSKRPLLNFLRRVAHRAVARSSRGKVTWLERFSYEAGPQWSRPIDFLLIDGDHREEAVEEDWKIWSRHLLEDGIAAFHDARLFPSGWTTADDGPVRFVNRTFRSNEAGEWMILDEVDSLVFVGRRQGAAHSTSSATMEGQA